MVDSSLWQHITSKQNAYPDLTNNIEVDVAIIGGGITGITTALHLLEAGKKVAIIEANRIGNGTTGYSTGNLYIATQPLYQNILAKFNEETVKSVAHSRKFAIDYIENNVREKNISCHFMRRPWFAYTNTTNKAKLLDKEIAILQKVGIEIDYTSNLPFHITFKKAAVMENQARFNPLQYVTSLAENLYQKGCFIFENTRVIDIEEKDICSVKTPKGEITAKKVVIATHTPIGINLSHTFTAPYRSYVVAVHLKNNSYPEGHLNDLDNTGSVHSISTHSITSDSPQILVVAGSHHKTGQSKNMYSHYNELENYVRKTFQVSEVVYHWSAQHYKSADNVPYIGLANRTAKHIYKATGFFADGLIYGTLAGIIIGDLILGKNNALTSTYQANRLKLAASAGFLLKENINILIQYLKDLPMGETKNFKDIKRGDGKVVEINGEKCGVSRDDMNNLHLVSAVCPHMKCIVNWNNAEKTWDCPCHGSRFSQEGIVIEGPAKIDLKKIDV